MRGRSYTRPAGNSSHAEIEIGLEGQECCKGNKLYQPCRNWEKT